MQAIILAGGKGVRLQPFTTILPKPLMPVGSYPILEIIVRQLKNDGFKEITFCVGYLASLIQAYFQDGKKWGVKIRYSVEKEPLGTAGPLALVEPLQDDFLVMNGDILTDIGFRDVYRFHKTSGGIATVCVCKKNVEISLGSIVLDKRRNLVDYVEKPRLSYFASMGIYCFRKRILAYIPKAKYLDLPGLIRALIRGEEHVPCYHFRGRWLDIGRPEDYGNADEVFRKHYEKRLG
jgi:NDP-sugar pyrophosphorylase family protein